MIDKLGVEYDFVIGGSKDKEKVEAALPMLEGVIAFPTTMFIGRDGLVKKGHTGFAGPGTGIYYGQHVQHFNEYVNELLNDDIASRTQERAEPDTEARTKDNGHGHTA